jgi:hypothetical protein
MLESEEIVRAATVINVGVQALSILKMVAVNALAHIAIADTNPGAMIEGILIEDTLKALKSMSSYMQELQSVLESNTGKLQ